MICYGDTSQEQEHESSCALISVIIHGSRDDCGPYGKTLASLQCLSLPLSLLGQPKACNAWGVAYRNGASRASSVVLKLFRADFFLGRTLDVDDADLQWALVARPIFGRVLDLVRPAIKGAGKVDSVTPPRA